MNTRTRWHRTRIHHPVAPRHLMVSRVRSVVPSIVRVTLTGPELHGFRSDGPTDHVKVYFPDPLTGTLTTPIQTPMGVTAPDAGPVISRDYTPLAFRDGPHPELDIDLVIHAGGGPAAAWARNAAPGMPLAIAGPRVSRLLPSADRFIVIADETAFASASRWFDRASTAAPVMALLSASEERTKHYFGDTTFSRVDITWLPDGLGSVGALLQDLGSIDERTFVSAAGEATALVPVQRYLRHDLSLPAEQMAINGYWNTGVAAWDHHAPIESPDTTKSD